jgi:hypothetical protein
MNDIPIDVETVRLLARLDGLSIPDEDLEPLAAALSAHLTSSTKIRERYGGLDAEPPLEFDARWE